jgi:D-serine deaminase-like pyridoxal phosphate-dependent protein
VLATVISTAAPGQAVIDAGSKTLSSDPSQPAPGIGFGRVVEYPAARIAKLNEEHGQIDVTACEARPAVGDVVSVIPNHVCPCVNLQNAVWWCDDGEPPRPLIVDARGRLV